MTDKELIKQEIEYRLSSGKYSINSKQALEDIIVFIDSLPEEPPVKGITWEDVNTLESLIYQVHNEYPSIGEKSFGLEVLERFQDCQDDIEEPASDDRINECLNWDKDYGCSTSPMNNCDSCPRAKWVEVKEEKKNYNERYKRIAQTEQFKESYCDKSVGKEEPASEDLEEAASEWDKAASFQPFYMQLDCKGNPCEVKQDITTHKESFKAGAEWQKKQMKKALQTEYEKGRFDMKEEMKVKEHINNIISCLEEFLQPGFPIFKAGISEEITWLNSLIIKND